MFEYLFKEPEKLTLKEFIEYTKENPNKFIRYCEVCIDKFGNIYMVSPSHQETLIWLCCKKYNTTKSDFLKSIDVTLAVDEYIISKEKYIAVWYDMIKISIDGVNSRQKKALMTLWKNGLISHDVCVSRCAEYQNYLVRKDMGFYD